MKTSEETLRAQRIIVCRHWAESSKTINNSHLIHHTGFLYPSMCSTSRSAKGASSQYTVRHSNYETVKFCVKFCRTFSMGNPLNHRSLILCLWNRKILPNINPLNHHSLILCWHMFVMKQDITLLNTCDSLYLMKVAVIHFATAIKKKNNSEYVKQKLYDCPYPAA